MATKYTSTIEIRCWKEHTCTGCGSAYAYEFVRKITGSSSSEAGARAEAQASAEKAMKSSTDMHPCPACGLYQPDMVGSVRSGKFGCLLFFAVLVYVVGIILLLMRYTSHPILAWVFGLGGALGFVLARRSAQWNPNADLAANRKVAEESSQAGRLMHTASNSSTKLVQNVTDVVTASQRIWLKLILASVALMLLPEGLRLLSGWPLNADTLPCIAGPGDEVEVYLKEDFQSLKGYWKGSSNVTLRKGTQTFRAQSSSNSDSWGSSISVKSSQKSTSVIPWVKFTIPENVGLTAGDEVTAQIKLAVSYPSSAGRTFNVQSGSYEASVPLKLSAPKTGYLYVLLWWCCISSGVLVFVVSAYKLMSGADDSRGQAHPTRLFSLNNDAPPPPLPPPGSPPRYSI